MHAWTLRITKIPLPAHVVPLFYTASQTELAASAKHAVYRCFFEVSMRSFPSRQSSPAVAIIYSTRGLAQSDVPLLSLLFLGAGQAHRMPVL